MFFSNWYTRTTYGLLILCRSTFSEFAAKYSKDERFRALEKMREREQLFNEYLVDIKKTVTKHKEELKTSSKTKAEKVGGDSLRSPARSVHEVGFVV